MSKESLVLKKFYLQRRARIPEIYAFLDSPFLWLKQLEFTFEYSKKRSHKQRSQ